MIAARPEHLTAVLRLGPLTSRYASVVGWVIDSFWHERIPYVSRTGRFDRIYVTDEDDVGDWRSACATTPIHVLPWGADTAQAVPVRKTVDIQRLGRMPPAWDDDAEGSGWARAQHLDYRGRPSFGQDDAEAQRNVDDALAVARFVLAFSNLTSGASYTHPTRDYLTARWTDGLAHGAVVAGAAPASTTARELLWPGATLELPRTTCGAAWPFSPRRTADGRPRRRRRIVAAHGICSIGGFASRSSLGTSASRPRSSRRSCERSRRRDGRGERARRGHGRRSRPSTVASMMRRRSARLSSSVD
nr:hypothetical protein GCM10025699_06740 [Microbacterium flavescens]